MTAGAPGRATLRPMRAADLDRVAGLEVELFGASAWTPGMLREELAGQGRWYSVAVAGDAVVGYTGLWFDGDVTQVMTLGVAPDAQQRGTGTQLLAALVARARELRSTAVLLEVAVDNGPAVALYERFGFERIGLRKRYYQPEDTDAHVMRLALDVPEGRVTEPARSSAGPRHP